MSRLHDEFRRLFQPTDGAAASDASGLFDDQGRTRAAVLAIAGPADADSVAAVWSRVQAEWGLPAPAIAVDGHDAMQLWFALAEPVDVTTALAFLEAVCRRCLPDVATHRLRLWPQAQPLRHVATVPAQSVGDDRWSAFVVPDLVPLFEATPWLDLPPGDAAQARILGGLAVVGPEQVAAVLASTIASPGPEPGSEAESPAVRGTRPGPDIADVRSPAAAAARPVTLDTRDPRVFLWSVMVDEHAPLALRVQAAAALLPGFDGRERPPPDPASRISAA